MSKPDSPEYPTIEAPKVAQGDALYNQAQNFFQNNGYGNLLNAQSTALNNANNPDYYSSFQPTSFEQALGNQQFQNIWPDEQAMIMNQLSKSGMAYSPVAASTLGNSYGRLATGIGEYLNTQANNRATGAIQDGLGINPMSFLSPYANLGAQQSNQQGAFDMQANTHNADAQYANNVGNYNQDLAQNGMLGSLVGGIGGGLIGGPQGAMMGANIGGSIFGGSGQGMNMGQAFQGAQGLPNSWSGILGQGNNGALPASTVQSVYKNGGSSAYGQPGTLPKNPYGGGGNWSFANA